jgi:serine/threonine-protein kinase
MFSERLSIVVDALSPRYRLERLLHRGGAACIYLAEDRSLGTMVAVKVLHEEMAATVDADRFRSEFSLLARLRHPNIVPVYDSGEIDGLPYYVMPFVEGETLRARLSRLRRLPFAETLRITEDVARALQFAHRYRTVHRDVKPENIMLDRDRALVLDFGIALALDGAEASRRTLPGLALGTVQYMSPEQVGGDAPIDERSDIYSLACVVYEMIAGHPPFTGGVTAVMHRHLATKPRSLSSVSPGTSPSLAAVLARALEKQPEDRYPTPGAFLAALRAAAPGVRPVEPRIAVASFVHVSGAPRVDACTDGMSEEVISALREFDNVIVAAEPPVVSRVSRHVAQIARAAGVDVVLLGEVRDRTDEAVLVSASLFDARTGRCIWRGTTTGSRCAGSLGISGPARDLAVAVGSALGLSRRPSASERPRGESTLAHSSRTISGAHGRSAVR